MDDQAAPVSDREFADAMAALGIEPKAGPVAVAVSGGADSMALALLAARRFKLHALIVDHRLREGSGAEAERVAGWLAARDIACTLLRRAGERPRRNIQNAAREARYRLMEDWCRAHGVRYLLLAHHRDDQAETLLLRLARGSGLRGLAGMAALAPPLAPESDLPRRARPLLDLPKARLVATCRSAGQTWIEDPSNRDLAHARSHARAMLAAPPLPGLDAARLAATARRLARAREAIEFYVDGHLARHAVIEQAGYARLALPGLLDAPQEIVLGALSRLFAMIGGRALPPRAARIEHVRLALAGSDFPGLTAVGCQLLPDRDGPDRDGKVLLCREPAAVAPPVTLTDGRALLWDGRFLVRLPGARGEQVGALGEAGWTELLARHPELRRHALPHPVRLALPALRAASGALLAVPHLPLPGTGPALDIMFRPQSRRD